MTEWPIAIKGKAPVKAETIEREATAFEVMVPQTQGDLPVFPATRLRHVSSR